MPNTSYDIQFLSLPFYKAHSYMMPFVGDFYVSSKHKKLLLIGESHYLPEKSIVHHDVDLWYAGTPVLTDEEKEWCNTVNARQYGYGKLNKPIEKDLLSFFSSDFNEIASYNYFLRPANERETFRNICTKTDRKFAVENLHNVLEILSPDLIVFASLYSYDFAEWKDYHKYFGEGLWDYTKRKGIEYIAVNHPSHGGWYKSVRGKDTSSKIFVDFLQKKWVK